MKKENSNYCHALQPLLSLVLHKLGHFAQVNYKSVRLVYIIIFCLKFSYACCTILDPLKHKLFNLVIQPNDYLGKLFKSRLT